jgi:hypothetical protein
MDPIYKKLFQELNKDKDFILARRRAIKKEFDKIKNEMLEEFNNHPVTREIEAGIDSPNISGTLNGRANLFSFIGFDAGSNPISPIRDLLDKSLFRIHSGNSATAIATFEIPTAKMIFSVTPLPWAAGRSWAKGIERGISGLGYYLKKAKGSRSGFGIQVRKQVRKGVRFKNIPYISALINKYEKKFKDLNKLKV